MRTFGELEHLYCQLELIERAFECCAAVQPKGCIGRVDLSRDARPLLTTSWAELRAGRYLIHRWC